MNTERIGKHTVEYFGDIEEMPVVRYNKWQRALLVDAGVGSDIAAFDRHCERLRIYLSKGQTEEAAKELDNLRQSVWMMQQEITPQHLAFAALVTKIDGRACDDLTDEALQRIVKELGDVPQNKLSGIIGRLKKKNRVRLNPLLPQVVRRQRNEGILRPVEEACR